MDAKVLTIVDAGPRKVEWTDTECLATTVNVDGTVTSTWSLGFVEQPLQIDCWAESDAELDDLLARLDASLNKGCKGVGAVNADPFATGLILHLADGWEGGHADYTFDSPDIENTSSSVNENEWRGSMRGVACMRLVQVATTPRIARINIKLRLRTLDPDDPTDPYDIITKTADGVTRTTGL